MSFLWWNNYFFNISWIHIIIFSAILFPINSLFRACSSCFMHAIVARMRMPFFKIFPNFVHFAQIFNYFALFWKIARMFLLSRICPAFCFSCFVDYFFGCSFCTIYCFCSSVQYFFPYLLDKFLENDKVIYLDIFSCSWLYRITCHLFYSLIRNAKWTLSYISNGLSCWSVNFIAVSSNTVL